MKCPLVLVRSCEQLINVWNFTSKLRATAKKMAKNSRGYFFAAHCRFTAERKTSTTTVSQSQAMHNCHSLYRHAHAKMSHNGVKYFFLISGGDVRNRLVSSRNFLERTHRTLSQCSTGDDRSQWETPNFGHPSPPNPSINRTKIWHGWLRRRWDPTCQKWLLSRPRRAGPVKGVKYNVQMWVLFFFLFIECQAPENTFLRVSPYFLQWMTCFGVVWFPRGVWTLTLTNFPV